MTHRQERITGPAHVTTFVTAVCAAVAWFSNRALMRNETDDSDRG